MKLYTAEDILTTNGKHVERLKFVTPEIRKNASTMAERLNALLILFGKWCDITSGFRDPVSNAQQDGAKRSWHLRALASDIADADRAMEKFISDGTALAACKLWAEAPDKKTRTHVQCEPPSGWKPGDKRIFKG